MHKLPVFIVLVFFSGLAGSQNIYTALQLNREQEYKTKSPAIIKETNIFYTSNGKQVDKATKTLDKAGMLAMEERYDDGGNLKARLTYKNDTANRLKLSRTFERWGTSEYSKETAFYFYDDDNHLTGTTEKNANGDIIQKTLLALNDKGQPIVLTTYDGNGKVYGKEIATYIDEQNKVVTSVISIDGKLLSTDTIKISFLQASQFAEIDETYNDKGDLIRWKSKSLNGTETFFEEEYIYDAFGNCTESTIYKLTFKANGNKKREVDRVFKKEYTY